MYSLQNSINYTRLITLILSILIVISSLCIYNYRSTPVYSLIDTVQEGEDMVNDMIQDRRLIATLVASQASIFCPLFLLMNTNEDKSPSSALAIEQFFQCLMPIGLVISWLFCIAFDQNLKIALDLKDHWIELFLRYSVVVVLVIEIMLIWIESFKYFFAVYKEEGNIRLCDEECAIFKDEGKRISLS
ncbi:hypothetical protein RO3G_00321 [Rhizopus delemar RA 99-880]|uniref:Uncharacterized protein n=1 Tax=Rhizopus delemar (strain RA 99-880 / ATCC MYA-4621 / FGSC 9543 / NRRL 43880) TaxID=246409 RepID=I1BHD7_RHIO9|nr:hypothetical protein RO3G_00321 [Rhizopus delemar RA 99-880]|eukprot:EIE75617.1 hypothetical protein RO3G_00321 [Rhizopus delemar RA 99-880]